MLRWRLISAAIILALLALLIWLDLVHNLGRPGIWFAPVVILVAALAAAEVLDLLSAKNLRPAVWSTYIGTVAVVVAASAPILWQQYPADCALGKLGWPLAALALGIGLSFVAEMRRYKQPGTSIVNVALGCFVMVYVGLLMSFIIELRLFRDNLWGMAALLSMIMVVKFSDIGAYTFGRSFGRHKMSPVLSPGKTVEGAIGGIFTACVVSWLVFQFFVPWLVGTSQAAAPWWGSLLYGLIVAVAGMLGDLSESLLKRDMGRKDSSTWLRGLGGVLDIIDSVLAAAPAAYMCWVVELVG